MPFTPRQLRQAVAQIFQERENEYNLADQAAQELTLRLNGPRNPNIPLHVHDGRNIFHADIDPKLRDMFGQFMPNPSLGIYSSPAQPPTEQIEYFLITTYNEYDDPNQLTQRLIATQGVRQVAGQLQFDFNGNTYPIELVLQYNTSA